MLRVVLTRASDIVREVRRMAAAVEPIVATPDGRWALVSVSITTSAALAIIWLALAAAPPVTASTYEPRRIQAALPYDLLVHLSGVRQLPGVLAEDSEGRRNFQTGVVPDTTLAAEQSGTSSPANLQTRTLTVENGDTMMGMLQEAGVSANDAIAVVDAMKTLYSPRSIRPGQMFEASFGVPDNIGGSLSRQIDPMLESSPRLISLSFAPSVEREIVVRLTAPNSYFAENIQKELELRYRHAGATIDSSLYLAAMQAGIPANIVVEMIHMFSYDVDFQRDVHPGDQFEVFFTDYYSAEGELAKSGSILAASMTLGGKINMLYRFETELEGVEYFDATGQSAKSLLMRTPVDGARISSGFGRRRHPILGYTRVHQGLDFAVPTGTPVMAAGNGTVVYAGRQGGYGNFVVINHSNGYQTAYAHLSRFGSAVRTGARVRQGQIVAYSGSTGMSTGPHLHYEVRVDGEQVNPLTVKVANGRRLEGQELLAYQAERTRIETLVASKPLQSQVADAIGLRDITEQ